VVEALLRKIATEDPKLFLEIAFGKVPQAVDVTSGGEKLAARVEVVEIIKVVRDEH
jgi:hypothetical protein